MLKGGVVITKKMASYLIGRLKDFNEWGQSMILTLLKKYEPSSDKEMFNIMNVLDDRLRKSCSAVVYAAISLFLKYTTGRPKLYQQVIGRIANPLITLMTGY